MRFSRTPEQKRKKMIFNHIDKMYKTAKSIAKAYRITGLPLSTIRIIVNESKVSETSGNKYEETHNKQFNKTLEAFHTGCQKITIKMKVSKVPLTIIKQALDSIKTAYAEGMIKDEDRKGYNETKQQLIDLDKSTKDKLSKLDKYKRNELSEYEKLKRKK